MSGPTSHLPSTLQTQWDYTKTLRSSSRLSWDGQFPPPSSSSPPPSHYEQHRDLSRPKSFSNFSESSSQDRWSYDRIRMPLSSSSYIETLPLAPYPQSAAQRPITPEETQKVLGLHPPSGYSASPQSPSSTRSRPVSAQITRLSIPSDSTNPSPLTSPNTPPSSFSPGESIPTLRITQPGNDSPESSSSVGNQTQHGSSTRSPRAAAPKQQEEPVEPSRQKRKPKIIQEDVDEPDDACCFGTCRRSKIKTAGGRVAGWLLGTLLPVAFGVVMGVVAKATGGR